MMTHMERERQSTAGESVSADKENVDVCPECGASLRGETADGELVCPACHVVVSERLIDHGPEWRAFTADERGDKSRVGAPTTEMLHDRGMSTVIGWGDKDAHGRTLDGETRRRFSRLRTWDERYRARDSKDRNLRHALGEISRMAASLGLPDPVTETAGATYRRALSEGLLPGRSIEGVATASLYAATRMEQVTRSLDEMVAVSRVDKLEIERTYRYLSRELELTIAPTAPTEFLPRIASTVNASDETERLARTLVEGAMDAGVHSGRDPVGIAASGIYAAAKLTGADIRQIDVAEAAGVSTVTVRNRYPEVLEANEHEEVT